MTDVSRIQYYPADTFHDKNEACEIKTDRLIALAGVANQDIVSSSSGKRIRALTVVAYSDGIATGIVLHSSSGTRPLSLYLPANTVATPNVILPHNEFGWVETDTGDSLQVDVAAAVIAVVSITYITYTP